MYEQFKTFITQKRNLIDQKGGFVNISGKNISVLQLNFEYPKLQEILDKLDVQLLKKRSDTQFLILRDSLHVVLWEILDAMRNKDDVALKQWQKKGREIIEELRR